MNKLEREKRRSDRVLDVIGFVLSFFLPGGPGDHGSSEEHRFQTVLILLLLLILAVLVGLAWMAGYI